MIETLWTGSIPGKAAATNYALRFATGQIVGIFDAGGTMSDSELWCDAAVLQPAYRRGGIPADDQAFGGLRLGQRVKHGKFGDVVLGLKPERKEDRDPFEEILEAKKRACGVRFDSEHVALHRALASLSRHQRAASAGTTSMWFIRTIGRPWPLPFRTAIRLARPGANSSSVTGTPSCSKGMQRMVTVKSSLILASSMVKCSPFPTWRYFR